MQTSFRTAFALACALCASAPGAQERGTGFGAAVQLAQSIGSEGLSNGLGLPNSLVLTLEPERFFAESDFGRRVAEDLQARSAVLTAENRRIEAELRAEEKDLADRRAFTEPQAFRALAQAFDEKVQNTRTTQNQKFREISGLEDKARVEFREISRPVLEQIMREVGAAVILERGSVLLSASSIDVTDLAIARINAMFGEGSRQSPQSGSGLEQNAGE
ncbi:Outer membrane protein [Tritonibacter multivorans]|uniref:Outer membrane protein n=1 Tax=Tritonibacter multivorans TaxID=928856 RepID=A0A0P1GKE8_9RHOB|nr:OmpH family outer membrane protein [Tritonibacter multivorans]MDA7421589.1 OmpH family outer membrane protein [Tritonibacter multivorans]CUH82117.1 Outer membrane protein [Tritonibacter multivorans]SFC94668.1 periplasmic chaperone for outer membrane proteins Skp [Tritonibacter multivorans]